MLDYNITKRIQKMFRVSEVTTVNEREILNQRGGFERISCKVCAT